ncbi:MAG: ribbon-helix-helix domain-containing protein [Holophagales bacterium]|nr:ribbon-helix-helix domain-containing protein [Holophagales bacterium]MYH27163.1 ribbon-helix-helix domain-containing protein [Holophagales bacterium]
MRRRDAKERGRGATPPRDETGGVPLTTIRISSRVDEAVWNELRNLARETRRSVSEVLSEAMEEYVARRRVRADALQHLEDSMRENEELGKLLE